MERDQLRAELNQLMQRVEDDAYKRGWSDAIANVLSAARSAHTVPTQQDTSEPSRPQQKAGYGAVGASIDLAFDAYGEHGITPGEVVEHARRELSETLKESSVRGRLNRMAKRGEVRAWRGRWFRVRPAEEASEQETGDADTSPAGRLPLENGGHRAAA